MSSNTLCEQHQALVKQAMSDVTIESAMRVFQAAQPAVTIHTFAVSASTANLQRMTTSRATFGTGR